MKNRFFVILLAALAAVLCFGTLSVFAQAQTTEELNPADFPTLKDYYLAEIKALISQVKEAYLAGDTDLVTRLMSQLSDVIQEAVDNIPELAINPAASIWNVYNKLSTAIESGATGAQLDALFTEVDDTLEEVITATEPPQPGPAVIVPGKPTPVVDHS